MNNVVKKRRKAGQNSKIVNRDKVQCTPFKFPCRAVCMNRRISLTIFYKSTKRTKEVTQEIGMWRYCKVLLTDSLQTLLGKQSADVDRDSKNDECVVH